MEKTAITVFLIFLVLKLIGVEPVADWSWWGVTSPIWGVILLHFVLLLIGYIFMGWKG